MRRGILALLLCGASVAAAQEGVPAALAVMIKRSQYRMVVQNVGGALSKDPDNPEAYALLGVSWSKLGYHSDALGAFALATGSTYYEQDLGVETHADSLRAVGQWEAAQELRLQRLVMAEREYGELRVLLGIMDDLRAAGRPEEALEWAALAEGLYPQLPQVHAQIADVYLDLERWEDADFHLWLMSQYGRATRATLVLARRALLEGNPNLAHEELERARERRMLSNQLTAMRAEVARQMGYPEDSAELLERNQWLLTEEVAIVAARIRAYTDLRDWAKAEENASRARAVYGANAEMRAALAYYDERKPRPAGVPR